MHAIFSDSTFAMTMYVSLCEYLKWYNLTEVRTVFCFDFQLFGGFDLFVTGRRHF